MQELLTADEQNLVRGFNPRLREVMGRGILSTQGAVHDEQRKALKPLFNRTELAEYAPRFARNAVEALDGWKHGQIIDVVPEMLSLSFRIITDVLFDMTLDTAGDLASLSKSTIPITGRVGYLKRFFAAKVRGSGDSEVREMIERFDSIVCPIVGDARRGRSSGCPAMIHRIIKIHDQRIDEETKSDRQTRDELLSFLFAGHETTAMALSWTIWLLSQNPSAERKLYHEVTTVIGNEVPTIDDLPRLTYTTATLRESLRLFPPVWLIARRCIDDWQLGPYPIPGRSYLHASPYVTHRDPKFYPEPEKFVPERFIGGPYADGRHKFAFFPFGGGDRRCLGDTFAQIEGVLLLACLAQRCKLRPLPGVRARTQPLISLRPRKGLFMQVIRRDDSRR